MFLTLRICKTITYKQKLLCYSTDKVIEMC